MFKKGQNVEFLFGVYGMVKAVVLNDQKEFDTTVRVALTDAKMTLYIYVPVQFVHLVLEGDDD